MYRILFDKSWLRPKSVEYSMLFAATTPAISYSELSSSSNSSSTQQLVSLTWYATLLQYMCTASFWSLIVWLCINRTLTGVEWAARYQDIAFGCSRIAYVGLMLLLDIRSLLFKLKTFSPFDLPTPPQKTKTKKPRKNAYSCCCCYLYLFFCFSRAISISTSES